VNRLELAQTLRSDAGISGSDDTTVNPTGEWADVVRWVDRAWKDIQTRHKGTWNWMRKSVQFNTLANQNEYDPEEAPMSLTDFGNWVPYSFRVYQGGDIGNQLDLAHWQSYESFRSSYLLGSLITEASRPNDVVISPSKSIILYPAPSDTTFTVTADYYSKPQVLALDDDTPEMPEEFHELILYRALMFFGQVEGATDTYAIGEKEFNQLYARLMADQLPRTVVNRRSS